MKGRIVVKIGSQVLCDPRGELNLAVLAQLAGQIAGLAADGWQVLVVSSGAVAAGHGVAGKAIDRVSDPVARKQVLAATGQVRLMEKDGDELKALRERMVSGQLRQGNGRVEPMRLQERYTDAVTESVQLTRPLKVVVDAGNGVAGELAVATLEALGCEVIPLFCEPDGNFPNHHPDPTVEENLADLKALVAEKKPNHLTFAIVPVMLLEEIIGPPLLVSNYKLRIEFRKPLDGRTDDFKISRRA